VYTWWYACQNESLRTWQHQRQREHCLNFLKDQTPGPADHRYQWADLVYRCHRMMMMMVYHGLVKTMTVCWLWFYDVFGRHKSHVVYHYKNEFPMGIPHFPHPVGKSRRNIHGLSWFPMVITTGSLWISSNELGIFCTNGDHDKPTGCSTKSHAAWIFIVWYGLPAVYRGVAKTGESRRINVCKWRECCLIIKRVLFLHVTCMYSL